MTIGTKPPETRQMTAHAAAAHDALMDICKQLAAGVPTESLGRLVAQIGTMMERRQ